MQLEEKFYVGEYGFYFTVETGLPLSGVSLGDVRAIIKRPNGSPVKRTIPLSDILDAQKGIVLVAVQNGDLNTEGEYSIQVVVRNQVTSMVRPSHAFEIAVQKSISDIGSAF